MRDRNIAVGRLGGLLVLVLLSAAAACAQVEVGENLKLTLTGAAGFAYGGGFGSYGGSSHSLGFNGNATLSGSYYHPNFLSFTLQPYYNRSQNNAASQSVFDATGLTATATLFSGSKFPGSISYGRSYSGSGEFGIPGVPGLTTSGSGQTFTITWSAFLPKLPTLTAGFSSSGNSSSILGTDTNTETSSKNFNLGSSYTLAGFNLNGFFNHQSMALSVPAFLGGGPGGSGTSSTSYGISATHRLPLSGNFGANWTRTGYASEGSSRGTNVTNNLTALVTISPVRKLTVAADVRYISNLFGALEESVLSGGGARLLPIDNDSHSLVLGSFATYALGRGFSLRGHITHRRQFYYGKEVSDTLYGGTVNYSYSRPLFGLLYFSFGMVDTANEQGNSHLGFTGNVGLNRKFGRWDTSADFSYSQNVQTLLTLYTTSAYTYGGYVRRRLNWNTYWNAAVRSSHSALTQRQGEGNRSHSLTTGLTWRSYGVTGGYSMSTGTTVLTASGLLTPTPVAGLITDDLVLFNGRSLTVGVFLSPLRKMTLTAHYAKARSDTTANSVFSLNQTERYNARLEYRLRQLTVIGGFTRDRQGFSASGAPPSVVNSYSIGISRWFNVF